MQRSRTATSNVQSRGEALLVLMWYGPTALHPQARTAHSTCWGKKAAWCFFLTYLDRLFGEHLNCSDFPSFWISFTRRYPEFRSHHERHQASRLWIQWLRRLRLVGWPNTKRNKLLHDTACVQCVQCVQCSKMFKVAALGWRDTAGRNRRLQQVLHEARSCKG